MMATAAAAAAAATATWSGGRAHGRAARPKRRASAVVPVAALDARGAASGVVAAGMACALSLTPVLPAAPPPPALGEVAVVDPGAGSARNPLKALFVEAWALSKMSFVDEGMVNAAWFDREVVDFLAGEDPGDAGEVYGRISGLLKRLGDPYTRFLDPEEASAFRRSATGELSGVGMLVASDAGTGNVVILESLPGSPSERAGLRAGDVVTEIDHYPASELRGAEIGNKLRGPLGSSVKVRYMRKDGRTGLDRERQVLLHRGHISVNPVVAFDLHDAEGGGSDKVVEYLGLSSFNEAAAGELVGAIQRAEGGKGEHRVGGLILDLRGNPGGLVESGLQTAGLFLHGGDTLMKTTAQGEEREAALLESHAPLTEVPMVVLVDRRSASASEILTGALKDNHRATVVGERTFGKGKIQSVFALSDGSALVLTVARYVTPFGTVIDGNGITPQVKCKLPDEQGSLSLEDAIDYKAYRERQAQTDPCVLAALKTLRAPPPKA